VSRRLRLSRKISRRLRLSAVPDRSALSETKFPFIFLKFEVQSPLEKLPRQRKISMSDPNIEQHGIKNVAAVHWNLTTPALYEKIVSRSEGLIAHLGPAVVRTGAYTGRSPKDKFIVYEPTSAEKSPGENRTSQ
jgi:hypothetical protein